MSVPISTFVSTPVVHTVPVDEFDWEANNMRMQYLTCPRHPNVKYLTKHPWQRRLHIIEWDDANACQCGISTMLVMVGEGD
jgi:hypothetical protein